MQKKIRISGELAYVLAILLMSFSVAMITATDFGVSMIVAPAYIISLKIPRLSFGQSEYLVQGLLFVVFCILMKKVKPIYFVSFITCLIYGAVLDLWRYVIPIFNPAVTPPGSLPLFQRILLYILGTPITALSVALFFKAYLYPQVYDFFVKGIADRFHLPRTKFKITFDILCLMTAVALSLLLFGGFRGIGVGTLVTTLVNGALIGASEKLLDRFFDFQPAFPKLAQHFELNR